MRADRRVLLVGGGLRGVRVLGVVGYIRQRNK